MLKTSTLLLVLLCACNARSASGTGPCVFANFAVRSVSPPDKLDVLLVIDNSEGMARQQAALARQLPRFINAARSGRTPRGTRFLSLRSIRVGVITADLGTGGFDNPTCEEPNFGDDGSLRRDRCDVVAPPFLDFRFGEVGVDAFSERAQCLADVGESGCTFQQPLDAALKALSFGDSELRFVNGSSGHQVGANGGFMRDDAFLSVVFLSSGDDCSAANPDVFNEASTRFTHPVMDQRCVHHDEALHSIERYVDGLLRLKGPDLLFVTVIAGIPLDLLPPDGERPDYDRLLSDARMEPGPDPDDPSRLRASCSGPGVQRAHAPERLIQVSRALEENDVEVTLGSVCTESDHAIDELVEAIAGRLPRLSCFNRPLPKDRTGRALCSMLEVMPLGATCAGQNNLGQLIDVDEDGREVCQVCQLDAEGRVIDLHPACTNASSGWYYDDVNVARGCERWPHRAVFVGGELAEGALIRFECRARPIAEAGIGASCLQSADCSGSDLSLECSDGSRTCQLPCTSDAGCQAAGLAGFLCTSAGASGYCTHPSCPAG